MIVYHGAQKVSSNCKQKYQIIPPISVKYQIFHIFLDNLPKIW